MPAKILSERIRELEEAHRLVVNAHEGCNMCTLLNHIEVHLAAFEDAGRLAVPPVAPPGRRKR